LTSCTQDVRISVLRANNKTLPVRIWGHFMAELADIAANIAGATQSPLRSDKTISRLTYRFITYRVIGYAIVDRLSTWPACKIATIIRALYISMTNNARVCHTRQLWNSKGISRTNTFPEPASTRYHAVTACNNARFGEGTFGGGGGYSTFFGGGGGYLTSCNRNVHISLWFLSS
jgi:hypothetical protein